MRSRSLAKVVLGACAALGGRVGVLLGAGGALGAALGVCGALGACAALGACGGGARTLPADVASSGGGDARGSGIEGAAGARAGGAAGGASADRGAGELGDERPAAGAGGAADGGPPLPKNAPAVVERPRAPLTVPEARRYMVALINRDRAAHGLAPVELDEGAPTAAGQRHAEDMVRLGYLGHWGSDGSVPEQRHTEAGGADMVLENALCFTDEAKRTVDERPLIDPKQVERAESLFYNEVPPNDGHRRNILKPAHTRVGVGVAQFVETAKELAVPCFAQEFVDGYGTYAPLPRKAKPGAKVHVEATLTNGARPTGVGVARIPLPKPIAASELNRRRSYPVPKPFQMYWGPGFVTPIVAKITGPKIEIDVPLSDKGQPGLYEVSVWAKLAGSDEQTMVSLRTVLVE
ncbi:MAG: CAP domain-containing protein [Labilithrix sp.]|nr:CAP domain-containing protein [Labilithrix sp.]